MLSRGEIYFNDRIEEAIGALVGQARAELRTLLRLFDGRILPALHLAMPCPLSSLSLAARKRALLAMSRGPVNRLRIGFRLSVILLFTITSVCGISCPLVPAGGGDGDTV